MNKEKTPRGFSRKLLAVCTCVLALAFSVIPALSLWLGDAQLLSQPHERTGQAGALALTSDDLYLTRVLKKYAQRDAMYGYQSASTSPDSMTWTAPLVLWDHLDALYNSGVLPEEWRDHCNGQIGSHIYSAQDSLGFTNYIAYVDDPEAPDYACYLAGVTVETESQKVTALFLSVDSAAALPAIDTDAVLAAYRGYLGLDAMEDWEDPTDTWFAGCALYSPRAELMLFCESGVFPAETYRGYEAFGGAGWTEELFDRTYLCLHALSLPEETVRAWQEYARTFPAGTNVWGKVDPNPNEADSGSAAPGALPFPVGTLHTQSWGSNEGGFYGCSSGTAYYGFVQANVSEDASGNRWEDWLIVRTDFETRVQTPLCIVPGCTHQDDSCPAFLRSRSDMEDFYIGIVNGQLYVLHNYWWTLIGRSNADTGKPIVWLERAAMDGSGRIRLAELPSEWQLLDAFLLTDGAALYGQYLDWSDSSIHGIRVALESGEYTTFSFGLDDDEELIGALEGQFILSRTIDTFPALAYPDVIAHQERYNIPNYFTYVRLAKKLVLLDPATGTRRDLTESLMPSIDDFTKYASLFTAFFQQQKYYSITGDAVSRPQIVLQSDPATGESRLLAQNDYNQGQGFWNIQGLQLFPSDSGAGEPYIYGSYWEDGDHQGFLLDVHDGAMLPIALRYQNAYSGTSPVIPLAQTDDGLWLVQTAEVPTAWGRYRFSYALAAPETVISGEGEVYPIEMWVSETPLG